MSPQLLFFYITLGILVLTAVLEFFFPRLLKRAATRIFLYSVGIVFAYLIIIGFLQYQAFQEGPLSNILGTKSGLEWFFGYVQLHFWNQYLISFIGGLIFFFIARYFNRKYHERFFWKEELYLAGTAILLVGYPGWFFYIILLLVGAAVGAAIFLRRGERLPLYHFWIPTAIVTLLAIQFWAVNQSWWGSFRF